MEILFNVSSTRSTGDTAATFGGHAQTEQQQGDLHPRQVKGTTQPL